MVSLRWNILRLQKNKEEKSVELKSCMEQLESGVRQMFGKR